MQSSGYSGYVVSMRTISFSTYLYRDLLVSVVCCETLFKSVCSDTMCMFLLEGFSRPLLGACGHVTKAKPDSIFCNIIAYALLS